MNLPYFDQIFAELEKENESMQKVFGHHVHWGYWEDPNAADGSLKDFQEAAEVLSKKVWGLAHIQEGQTILEVGCGFGGNIAGINESFQNVKLVGLNIDERQINRARKLVKPRGGNQIEFVVGDACELPFEENSFDRILAVECIFHFPDADKFFQDSAKVLKPGGYLSLSDFVAGVQLPGFAKTYLKRNGIPFYGDLQLRTINDYRALAEKHGFDVVAVEDINQNTFPTFPVIMGVFSNNRLGRALTKVAEVAQKTKFIKYHMLAFRKNESIA